MHDYDTIDLNRFWLLIERDMPLLKAAWPGCAAGAVTGQTTRLNGSDHASTDDKASRPFQEV